MNIAGRYPLSTGDGTAIPFHVIRPIELGRIDYTSTPSGVISIGLTNQVAVLYASSDCIVRFGNVVSIPSSGSSLTDALYIPAGFIVSCQFSDDGLSVVEVSEPGTLWIQLHQTWELLKSSLAGSRR